MSVLGACGAEMPGLSLARVVLSSALLFKQPSQRLARCCIAQQQQWWWWW